MILFFVLLQRITSSSLLIVTIVALNTAWVLSADSLTQEQQHTKQTISVILDLIKEGWKEQERSRWRPYLTLTFAQSLDGKLAPYVDPNEETTAANYVISGPESLLMTHALRSIHDGILVGGRTLSIDNPRLTNRLWCNGNTAQPRPIVLDPTLQHIQQISTSIRSNRPLVFCNSDVTTSESHIIPGSCEIVPSPSLENGHLDLEQVLLTLKSKYGIHSIMVEGGPTVLNSFLDRGFFDCQCITVAPWWIGPGIGIQTSVPLERAKRPIFKQLGGDVVIIINDKANDT